MTEGEGRRGFMDVCVTTKDPWRYETLVVKRNRRLSLHSNTRVQRGTTRKKVWRTNLTGTRGVTVGVVNITVKERSQGIEWGGINGLRRKEGYGLKIQP